ncbi:acetyl-CoA synthetase-like protein [Aureobasidium subglaciale]|nr:acetyl-CoA synthetase-like protein [Aureobasidium subglaciale]
MAINVPQSALFRALRAHNPASTAIVEYQSGQSYSYGALLSTVARAKDNLFKGLGRDMIPGERVAFLIVNGYNYIVTLLAIFASNAIAVPLVLSFPVSELRHIINLSEAGILLSSTKYAAKVKEVLTEGLHDVPTLFEIGNLLDQSQESINSDLLLDTSASGMMLFTSGTTAKPKGVMLSETTLTAQAKSLMTAWQYEPFNAIFTPLLAGSSIEFMYPCKVDEVWKRFAAPFIGSNGAVDHTRKVDDMKSRDSRPPITFFTAVPTIWSRLLEAYPPLSPKLQVAAKEAISRRYLRLNISGSAALPKPIRDGWTELSDGNILLERYSMTEVGMALSCGLADVDRVDGCVGWPLPSVEARLVETNDETGFQTIIAHGEEIDQTSGRERQGVVQLRGPTVFSGYWADPAATAKEFTDDGWFKTGDIAIRRKVSGSGQGESGSWAKGPAYFIQGRLSAEIIKTGGEKVSALEIEREILSLPEVNECAVLGLPSQMWGQKVVAVIVLSKDRADEASRSLSELRSRLRSRLIPQDQEIVQTIKRNAMGKINKKELAQAVFGDMERIRRRSVVLREHLGKNDNLILSRCLYMQLIYVVVFLSNAKAGGEAGIRNRQ